MPGVDIAPRKKKAIEPKEEEWTDAFANTGKDALGTAEQGIKTVGGEMNGVFRDYPNVGMIVCGGVGLGGAGWRPGHRCS